MWDAAEDHEVEVDSVSVALDVSSSGKASDGIGNAAVISSGSFLSAALGLRSSSCTSVKGVSGV